MVFSKETRFSSRVVAANTHQVPGIYRLSWAGGAQRSRPVPSGIDPWQRRTAVDLGVARRRRGDAREGETQFAGFLMYEKD